MITIPLPDVVAFLRPRDALAILDGAPFVGMMGDLHAIRLPEDALKKHALLYLGDGDLCPAAEGWVIRVLMMVLGMHIRQGGFFEIVSGGVALYWPTGDDRLARQVWSWHPVHVAGWQRVGGMRDLPPTLAARVAAVLRYELGRAP